MLSLYLERVSVLTAPLVCCRLNGNYGQPPGGGLQGIKKLKMFIAPVPKYGEYICSGSKGMT